MKHAYLTIDDAPSRDFTLKVDFLHQNSIPALFFCTGEHLEKRPDEVCEALRRGFVIGNHSYSHPHFSDLTFDEGCSEILKTDRLIEQLYREAGVERPGKFFRFPFFDSGGDSSGKDYEGKWSQPKETWNRYAQAEKKAALQTFLAAQGFRQPAWSGISTRFFHERLLLDIDVKCTFDHMEYYLGQPGAPWGLSTPEAILARMEEDVPFEGRSLNCEETSDIILVHDHEPTTDLFFLIVERYKAKGIAFHRAQ